MYFKCDIEDRFSKIQSQTTEVAEVNTNWVEYVKQLTIAHYSV